MFHVKHEGWPEVAAKLGVSLPDRADEQLDAYDELLRRYAVPRGMVGSGDVERLRERHISDGLRGAPFLAARSTVVDLGSGAGLPGIPLAVVRPDIAMTLVEARRSRAAFLELAVDTLELPGVHVVAARVEDLDERFQACVARAFAPLRETWNVAERLLDPSGTLLYWGGKELTETALVLPGTRATIAANPPTSALAEAGPIVIMTRQ